ncbi:phasin family protein [Paraneptunicella aestuarii]|uniref:phasin family protein n=1 Tax=Paraneptunicella aestuarii TaxID=2831148 RepID=UPI001E355809|nr:phasin family protein [Paraneptunicella aestuarii]UAA37328.1 phasin family protein [Paraneptunicella aestuarii]
MFDQVNAQIQKSLQPLTELAAVNAKTIEQLAEKQSSLISSLISDGASFSNQITQQQDVGSMINAQKTFWEGVQKKLMDTGKESYELIANAQEKASNVFKESMQAATQTTEKDPEEK